MDPLKLRSEDPHPASVTISRSRPVHDQVPQSSSSASEDSEAGWKGRVNGLQFATSTDFQASLNQLMQGAGEGSMRELLGRLHQVSNPDMTDLELENLMNGTIKLEPCEMPIDESPDGAIRVSFPVPYSVTVGDIMGSPQPTADRPPPPPEKPTDLSGSEESVGTRETMKDSSPPAAMRPFVYEPLSGPGPEIRLLHLVRHPGPNEQSQLHLSLASFPLDQAPPFRAISYCWGDAKARTEIVCNNQTLSITNSLDCAIKRILNWKSDRYLWADGICINQEDLSERASQVKLMGEIYTKAESTVAYLGEALAADEGDDSTGPDQAQAGLALMMQLNAIWSDEEDETGHDDDHYQQQLRSAEEWKQIQIPDAQSVEELHLWVSLMHLCSQPWFSRSWVLQEVVLAKEVIVFYGGAVNGLRSLTKFWELATTRDPPPALMHGMVADWKDGTESWNQLNVFGDMRKAKVAQEAGEGLVHQPGDSGFVLDGERQRSHSLLNLLARNRSADATDSRDKVYSLLGLAVDVNVVTEIEPDYSPSNTPAKLYQHIASVYISMGRGIEVLHHAGMPQRLDGLPSWVPDWSIKSRQPLYSEQYRCTRDTIPHLRLLPCAHGGGDDNSHLGLRVQGAILDVACVLMHKVSLQRLSPFTDQLQDWFKGFETMWSIEKDAFAPPMNLSPGRDPTFGAIVSHAEMFALMLLTSSPHEQGSVQGIREAVWQTLAAGRGWARPDDPGGEARAHEAWCSWRPDPSDDKWWPPRPLTAAEREAIWPFQAIVLKTAQGYRFGLTACGYMGLFPSECEMGDLIAVIPGASTPFVIRPKPGAESGTAGPSPTFTLVGPCYIHGIMNGELLKPSQHGDIQDVHNANMRYRVCQRGWGPLSGEHPRKLLKPYFNPDISRYVTLRSIDLH